jgi:hypothetical protein
MIMDLITATYASYLALSIGLTVWVARTLSKNGLPFLVDVFSGNQLLAQSVNHLLVVGFYLINLGWVCLALKLGYDVHTIRESVEALSSKIGLVMLVLGALHFTNILVFTQLRSYVAGSGQTQPPVAPDGFTNIGV